MAAATAMEATQLMMLQQSNEKLMAVAHMMMSSMYTLIQLLDTQRAERIEYKHADVMHWSDADMWQMTRFNHDDLHRIVAAMQLPSHIITDNNTRIDTYTAMVMLLRRLVFPNRQGDMSREFGWSRSMICRIVSRMMEMLITRYNDLITFWPGITQQSVRQYADMVTAKHAAVTNIWGCIDGTLRYVCKPQVMQRASYSGYKKRHAQKYQSVTTPDGLCVSLMGAEGGNRNDSLILTDSGLIQRLQPLIHQNGERFYMYGDSAYSAHHDVMSPYADPASDDERQLNKLFSQVRVMVEHGFARTVKYYAFTDYVKLQRMHLSPTAAIYRLSVFFANIHSCIYGNQTATDYNVRPPTVEQYLDPSLLQHD